VSRAGRAWPCLGTAALGALLATTAGWSAGCSWIFTQPLPDNWRNYDQLDCSTNPVPPLIDSFLFLTNAGTTAYVVAFDDLHGRALPLAAGVIATTLWLSSAIYGYSKTNACRDALGESAHGYHPPVYGTGGEVFGPPPTSKPAPAPRDKEDPGSPPPRPMPQKPDAPRFGG
jgi:hypothetical protein